jgi:hypothetical protein
MQPRDKQKDKSSVDFVLECQTESCAVPPTNCIVDVLLPAVVGAVELPVKIRAIHGENERARASGGVGKQAVATRLPPLPINNFVDDPSRLFFTVGPVTLEMLSLLQIPAPDADGVGGATSVLLDEAAVRRIVREVVAEENTKLLRAIESLLSKNLSTSRSSL